MRNKHLLLCSFLCMVLFTMACGKNTPPIKLTEPDNENASQVETVAASSNNEISYLETGMQTMSTEPSTQEVTQETTQEVTQEAPAKPAKEGAVYIGKTSKGYEIYEIDGITYINDVLVVNKTYSLPSTYYPGGLDDEVINAFYAMQADAWTNNLNLYISSGFRSYDWQNTIYNNYVSRDGQALADTYSARAGFSEHQTGLCFDLNSIDDSFTYTPEGKWVAEHAHEYGFVVRYPLGKEDITGYMHESWHLRYLGVEMATDMYNKGLCLEEYFGITSKYAE